MKPLSELSHYEVLEIGTGAGSEDVERAYRIARATWGKGSLAGYSLYADEEVAALRERVELAYRILSDPEQRSQYDSSSCAGGEAVHEDLQIAITLAGGPPPELPSAQEVTDLAVFEDDDDAPWDGARLRRARLQRGLDLEGIAETTKVSPRHLRLIEEERFVDLPADVYVRGFVVAFARTLGLESERVGADYVERLREARVVEPVRTRGRRR